MVMQDPANGREALIECDLDVAEGADILMVKPGKYFPKYCFAFPYLNFLNYSLRTFRHALFGCDLSLTAT